MKQTSKIKSTNLKLVVIGLGYVGLPLAVEFGKKRNVIGFDIDEKRISDLKENKDFNLEVSQKDLKSAKYLSLTNKSSKISNSNCYIVTVPTPINNNKEPDLNPLKRATETIGQILKYNDIVIYESTVYPGVTEEICVPILEKTSGLKFNKEFYCGYSPERVNPGDKEHRINTIKKVTSGSTPYIANVIDNLYNDIITVGTHKAESIKIAEAAKIIENTQRDLNIALINELAIIFNKLKIDTTKVLDAAGSKWNFLPFKPGLVGGHCIGVDPYYLTHKARMIGYTPEIILSGRKINDQMPDYISKKTIELLKNKGFNVKNSNILVLGLSFKENCPDLRNSKTLDLIYNLQEFGCKVTAHDPVVNVNETKKNFNFFTSDWESIQKVDAIILAVPHLQYFEMTMDKILQKLKPNRIVFDIKSFFDINVVKEKGHEIWRL